MDDKIFKLFIAALKNRAAVYEFTGNYKACVADIRTGITALERRKRLDPDAVMGLKTDLADMALHMEGNVKKAASILNEAEKTVPGISGEAAAYKDNILGIIRWQEGRFDEALACLGRTLSFYKRRGEKSGISNTLNNMAMVSENKGDIKMAVKYLRAALDIQKKVKNKRGICVMSVNLGNNLVSLNRYEEAEAYFNEVIRISGRIGFKRAEGLASNALGGMYSNKGDLKRALFYYEKSLKVAEETGSAQRTGIAYNNIAIVHTQTGRYEKALEYYKKNLEISEKLESDNMRSYSYINLASACLDMNMTKEGAFYLGKAAGIVNASGNKAQLVDVHTTYSDLHIRRREFGKALKRAVMALELTNEIGLEERRPFVLRNLGLCQLRFDRMKAEECFIRSLNVALKAGMLLDSAYAGYELGKMYSLDKRKKRQAAKYLQDAQSIFEKNGIKIHSKEIKGILKKLKR